MKWGDDSDDGSVSRGQSGKAIDGVDLTINRTSVPVTVTAEPRDRDGGKRNVVPWIKQWRLKDGTRTAAECDCRGGIIAEGVTRPHTLGLACTTHRHHAASGYLQGI